jgi:hypothetical protein
MNRIQTIAAGLVLSLAATAMSQNLIPSNPGFESQGSGWTLFLQSGTQAVASVTYPTGGAHSGNRYARVAVTEPAASASENWHVQFQPPTGWSSIAGTTYLFKFWAKSDSSRTIHVSVQGSDYTYLTGQSFGLSTEWTEYSLEHTTEAEGNNGVRFHVYVGEARDVYSFDDFSVTAIATGVRGGASTSAQGLRVRQQAGSLVLSLGAKVTGSWNAELVDLQGNSIASATGSNGSLVLAQPAQSGVYFVRAKSQNRAWVKKVTIP